MATKIFISQPMKGKTDQEIIGERTNVRCFLTKMLKEPIEIIDSIIDEKPDDSIDIDRIPVWYLSKSIELLAKADIAFFCREWKEARGCVIEHEVAERYGITIIEE